MTQRFLISCTKTGNFCANGITSHREAHERAIELGLKDYDIAEIILVEEGFFLICEATGKVREARDPRPGQPGAAILEGGVIYATEAFAASGFGRASFPTRPAAPRGLFTPSWKG